MLRFRPVHRELKHLLTPCAALTLGTKGGNQHPPSPPAQCAPICSKDGRWGGRDRRTRPLTGHLLLSTRPNTYRHVSPHTHIRTEQECPTLIGKWGSCGRHSRVCVWWAVGGWAGRPKEVPFLGWARGSRVPPQWTAVSGRPAGFLPPCTGLSESEYQLPGSLPPES